MCKGQIKKEDLEFLKELQNEMLTQDTVGQASPRFWVVMQEEKEYWVEDSVDGIFVVSNDGLDFEGDICKIGDWLKEEFDNQDLEIPEVKVINGLVEIIYKDKEYDIYFAKCLEEFLNKFLYGEYSVGYYRNKHEIVKNTMFLTLRECREHIEANKHHYNETAHPYAMTAWRSPQVSRLYEILEKTNWNNIRSIKE